MCSQVLDGLKMVFIAKSNANLVINTTCVLLYLSRAIYIFQCKNLVYKVYFGWVISVHDFSGPRLRRWSFCFCVSIFLLAFLSVHCVSPHRRSHKPRRISTLKTKKSSFVFTSLTTNYRWEWIFNSRKITRWCQYWRFQVSLQRKSISGTYLISITSLPEDEQRLSMGEEVGTMQF
jgi:hypothetical protein